MKTYRIYKHPKHPVSTVVKVGFSWPAFIIGPLWYLLNKMWLTFLLSVALFIGAPLVLRQFERPENRTEALIGLLLSVLYFIIWFITGKIANFLLGEELLRNGYSVVATVEARSADDARLEASRQQSLKNVT